MPGSRLYSTVEAGRARLPAQHDLQSKRLLCSIGRAAEVCIKESTAASQKLPKALHAYQQRRSAFGLPNLNGDTSKHYQERRLIGCAFVLLDTFTAYIPGVSGSVQLKM